MDNISIQPTIFSAIYHTGTQSDPWLVMVHGFTHDHTYFRRQIEEFQRDYRILAVDLRGHGNSSHIPGPYGVEEYADDIQAVMDNAGIKRAVYWGTHTGSAIGLILTLRQPERFNSLILEGTFLPGYPMPRVGELIDRARSVIREKGLQAARDDWFEHADWFDHIIRNPEVCRAEEHRAMVNRFEGAPWLADLPARPVTSAADHLQKIRQPVLLYNGMDDLEDFKRAAEFLSKNLPCNRREVIPNAGGFPGWENPDAVNNLVQSFLNQSIS